MLHQPALVLTAGQELLAAARERALAREIPVALYTRELFSTSHDEANRAAVAAVAAQGLDLVGIALRGPGTWWTGSSRVHECTRDCPFKDPTERVDQYDESGTQYQCRP